MAEASYKMYYLWWFVGYIHRMGNVSAIQRMTMSLFKVIIFFVSLATCTSPFFFIFCLHIRFLPVIWAVWYYDVSSEKHITGVYMFEYNGRLCIISNFLTYSDRIHVWVMHGDRDSTSLNQFPSFHENLFNKLIQLLKLFIKYTRLPI